MPKPKINGPKPVKPAKAGGGAPVDYRQVKVKGSPFTLGQMEDAGMYRPLGGGGATQAGPATFVNEAQPDPRLAGHLDRLDKRMNDPAGSTGRAIDMAGSKIRDAYDGRRGALKGMMAGRGVLGSTSIPMLSEAAMADAEGRDVAGKAADISLARERDNDQFMLGATGAYTAAAGIDQANRRLGMDQAFGERGLSLQERSLANSQQRQELEDLLRVLGSF
jgi:hypothetical protein